MPLEIVKGDIFDSGCEALVNPVNCVGVMGAGLAKQFAARFPGMLEAYREVCRDYEIRLGSVWVWKAPPEEPATRYVVCFPTMHRPGERTLGLAIVRGFCDLVNAVDFYQIKSIALPALGCGIWRYDWEKLQKIAGTFSRSVPNCEVKLYEPK